MLFLLYFIHISFLHKTSHFVFRDINVAVLANSIHWFASLAGRLKVNVFSLPVHDFPDKFRLAYSSASVNDDELRIFSLQGIIDPFKIVFSVDEVFKFHIALNISFTKIIFLEDIPKGDMILFYYINLLSI